ncbi:MAG: DUF3450 family protein [Verrucomicrobiota bacterium]
MPGRLSYKKRNCGLFAQIALLTALACVASGEPDAADSNRTQLARDIRETIERSDRLTLEAARLEDQRRRAMDELDTHIGRLRKDVDRTGNALEAAKQDVEDIRANIKELRSSHERSKTLLARASRLALDKVEQIHSQVASGIPYRKEERLSMLQRILEGLRNTDPVSQADALLSLWTYAGKESMTAQTIDLRNERVQIDSGRRAVHAYVVRIGLASEFFVSEDGNRIGIASGKSGEAWNEDLPDLVRGRILNTINILRAQAHPRIIPVPFPVFKTGDAAPKNRDQHETPAQGNNTK